MDLPDWVNEFLNAPHLPPTPEELKQRALDWADPGAQMRKVLRIPEPLPLPSEGRALLDAMNPPTQAEAYKSLGEHTGYSQAQSAHDMARSAFRRALLRGEAPDISNPMTRGSLPPMIDPGGIPGHPDVHGWGDPEWIKKFQEAYRASFNAQWRPEDVAAYRRTHPHAFDWLFNDAAGGQVHGQNFQHPLVGRTSGEVITANRDVASLLEALGDKRWRPESSDAITDPRYPGSRFNPNSSIWEISDVRYPPTGEAEYKFVPGWKSRLDETARNDFSAFFDNPLKVLGRLNPTEFAKNLASRVNSGPIGPWDVFPGGMEGWLDYVSQGNPGLQSIVDGLFGRDREATGEMI